MKMGFFVSSDNCPNPSLDEIIAADQWARQEVLSASKALERVNFFVKLH
jgi:1-deoxy-D-xylulose-5-phosphate reductoisomerase